MLRVFHLLAWFCSVLGSGQQVPVYERVVGTVRGRQSDELDFLLRQVEQAFT